MPTRKDPRVYYNDSDPYCANRLRNHIADGLLPDGFVDERDIRDVQPGDLEPFVQCHFFAGIGGWSRGLGLAGLPNEVPLWTGSCPCQPLSSAGRRKAHADERHLWPDFRRLIALCGPSAVCGEQVASNLGRAWLAEVRFDFEHIAYWRAYEASLPHLRRAPSLAEVSEVCADAFGRVETDACGAVQPAPPTPIGAAGPDKPWQPKTGRRGAARARHATWTSILEDQGDLFGDGCGDGEVGGAGIRDDCARLFGSEHLRDERAFSERVRCLFAASVGRLRLAGVRLDVGTVGYAVGGGDLPAACVAAPHIRQRLWFMAYAPREQVGGTG